MIYFGLLGLSPDELGDLVQRTRRILAGRPAGAAQIRTIEHCMRSLPDDGQITFMADPCAARGVESVRLIARMPRVEAWPWLQRIGWSGSPDQWEQVSSAFANGPLHISVYLDVADTIGPNLGVESTLPAPDSARQLWEEVSERLVDLGAVTSEEAAAVMAWGGRETVDLPGVESLTRIDRWPGYKCVLAAEGGISAKAYLAFRAQETLF